MYICLKYSCRKLYSTTKIRRYMQELFSEGTYYAQQIKFLTIADNPTLSYVFAGRTIHLASCQKCDRCGKEVSQMW